MDKSTKKCLKSWSILGWSFSEIDPGGGFLSHGGTPKWLAYKGKSQSKMDDNWGYPYSRKPPLKLDIAGYSWV